MLCAEVDIIQAFFGVHSPLYFLAVIILVRITWEKGQGKQKTKYYVARYHPLYDHSKGIPRNQRLHSPSYTLIDF